MNNIYTRYFIFSKKNAIQRKEINNKAGRVYTPGTVVVNGVPKNYTDIVTDMSKAPSDGVLILSGDIRKINYIKEDIRRI